LSGGLLIFDGAGRPSLLIVKNDEDLDFAAKSLAENNVSQILNICDLEIMKFHFVHYSLDEPI